MVRKVQRWHLFPKDFRNPNSYKRVLRAFFIRMQEWFGVKRNKGIPFKKGSQWVSITDAMARIFLENREWALHTFSNTFCSDEMVMQTLCWASPLRGNLYDTDHDAEGCQRAIHWVDGTLLDWNEKDFDYLSRSPYLFARKFNMNDRPFIQRVLSLSSR